MKVSISLPDQLFEQAEELVRRTGKTRSQVYRLALQSYVARRDSDRVRELIDATLRNIADLRNDFTNASASRTLERSEW
jgi:metal-responsive CopG/Arc/MetJ family transcriptional regulator